MDGTCLDTPHVQYLWLRQTAAKYGGLDPFPAFDAGFLNKYNDWLGRKRMPGLYEMIGVDFPGNRDAIHHDYDMFNQTHPIETVPGMPEAIVAFKGLGLRIGVNTTKSRRSIMAPLSRNGLDSMFDAYVTEDDIHAMAEMRRLPKTELAKPHGFSAGRILEKLGVAAEHAVAVEDDTIGITTYRNDGPRPFVVGVTWGFEPDAGRLREAGADEIVRTPDELVAVIRGLARQG
jgi:phosphoglycolate phosphatase-like HAD superfamily hydrolase